MITGLHVVIYSEDAQKDRAFLRDVLEFPHVDVGEGWLIFAMPPSEVAVHPATVGGHHEAFLMCDDVTKQMGVLRKAGCECTPIVDEGWGLLTTFKLPGGGSLGLYQPKHSRPPENAEVAD